MAEARSGNFALDVRAWCEKAKANTDEIVRRVSIALLDEVIKLSPVGNPELWAANAHVMAQRASYNDEIARSNSLLDENPFLRQKYGLRKKRTLSEKGIRKRLPLESGKGYVGGRFRGNWTVQIGTSQGAPTANIDPVGSRTKERGEAVIASVQAGGIIYLMNHLPYAIPLEYGHSKRQAPNGMVRITAARFQTIVNEEVAKLP